MDRPNNKIWCMRKLTGLTQEKFCEVFHVPRRTLQTWETGERTPKPLTLRGLEEAVRIYLNAEQTEKKFKD